MADEKPKDAAQPAKADTAKTDTAKQATPAPVDPKKEVKLRNVQENDQRKRKGVTLREVREDHNKKG